MPCKIPRFHKICAREGSRTPEFLVQRLYYRAQICASVKIAVWLTAAGVIRNFQVAVFQSFDKGRIKFQEIRRDQAVFDAVFLTVKRILVSPSVQMPVDA